MMNTDDIKWRKNKSWIGITFYTDDLSPVRNTLSDTPTTTFKNLANNLIQSGQEHGVLIVPYEMPSKGNLRINQTHKPTVIMRAMEQYPDMNIVYIDADARLMRYPILFDKYPFDLACLWRYDRNENRFLASNGTIYLRNCEAVYDLVSRWNEHIAGKSYVKEQNEFEKFYHYDPTVNAASTLPPEYCMVVVSGKPIDKNVHYNDIVIMHGRTLREKGLR